MRPGVLLGGAWVAATAVAVVVAVQGVGFVGREVTDRRPAALSVEEVRAALRAGKATASPTSSTSAPTSTTVPAGAQPGATTTVARLANGSRPQSGFSATGSGSTSSGTSGGGGSTPAPVGPTTRTYTLEGGSVAIRFEPGKVTVVWATPNSGYEVDVETYAADRVEVRFRSETHESQVTAWWDGAPRDEIDEEDRSSDSESDSGSD